MSGPQKEHGYTPVANEIIEKLIKLPLNGTQWRIIAVVWRYTYGFSRKNHALSEGFISKGTGIHKKQIQREMNELINNCILSVVKEATFSSSRIIEFNKHYESWEVTKKIPGNKKVTHTGSELVTTTGSELVTQENNNKTNIKTNEHEEFFESLWKLYPKKKGKGQVSATQKKKLFKIGEEMTRAIERCKREKTDTDIQYWQNGSTFFNSGYIDYLDKNYTEPEQPRTRGW